MKRVNEENIGKVLDRFEEVFEEHLYDDKVQSRLHTKNRYKTLDSCIEHIMRLFRESKGKIIGMLWRDEI